MHRPSRGPPDRVVVTPNGRDPEVFHPADAGEPAAGDDEVPPGHLLFVGALTSGKRPERFIEVVAALRPRGLDLRAT